VHENLQIKKKDTKDGEKREGGEEREREDITFTQ
jgi:hypothetical protein